MWCAAQGTSNTHGTALRDHAVQGQHTEERTTASTDRSPLARRARRWRRRARCDRVRTLDVGAVVRAQRAQDADNRLPSGMRLRSKSGNCWAVVGHCFLPPRQAEEDIMGDRRHAAALPQHFRRTGTTHTLCAPPSAASGGRGRRGCPRSLVRALVSVAHSCPLPLSVRGGRGHEHRRSR